MRRIRSIASEWSAGKWAQFVFGEGVSHVIIIAMIEKVSCFLPTSREQSITLLELPRNSDT